MKKRLDHIDGLRGFAAIIVAIGHWFEFVERQNIPNNLQIFLNATLFEYFSPGKMGVVAFFCISGFVIPFSFRGQNPLSNFVISRIFRLYPAYWIACLIAIFALPSIKSALNGEMILANSTMLTAFLGYPYIIGVAWTLTIELIFYSICFWACFFKLLTSARFNLFCIALFSLLALGMGIWRWYHIDSALPAGTATFIAAMHFGTFVRLWLIEHDPLAERSGPATLIAFLTVSTISGFLAYRYNSPDLVGYISVCTGFIAGVLIFFFCVYFQIFSSRPMVFLGSISYSLYLIHAVLLENTAHYWYSFDKWWLSITILTSIYLISSVFSATLIYKLIEIPAQRAGKRIKLPFGNSQTA